MNVVFEAQRRGPCPNGWGPFFYFRRGNMQIIIGALIFLAGYLLCYFTVKKPITTAELITEVKRIKPSLRNPLKTYNVRYEKFKSRSSGLYEPQKPKRGD